MMTVYVSYIRRCGVQHPRPRFYSLVSVALSTARLPLSPQTTRVLAGEPWLGEWATGWRLDASWTSTSCGRFKLIRFTA